MGRPVKFHEIDLRKDIRYRGPLSYRAFAILGWVCIILTQVLLLMRLAHRVAPDTAPDFTAWIALLERVEDLSLPFLLLYNFAVLLDTREGFRMQLIRNGAAMLGIAGLFLIAYRHNLLGIVSVFAADKTQVEPFVMAAFQSVVPVGFVDFNIFVDLFLCTLMTFFLMYRPRRIFTGRWRIVFRLFALLPIAYEVGSFLLKVEAVVTGVALSPIVYPFLTVKPIVTFLVFVVIILFIKIREKLFCRHGRTPEAYMEFLQSNRNSLHFSIFVAILLLVAGILDKFLSYFVGSFNLAGELVRGVITEEEFMRQLETGAIDLEGLSTAARAMGVGGASGLTVLAPLMLLFSYNRTHRNKLIDLFIPVAAVAVILVVYIQGIYQILHVLPLPTLDLNEARKMLEELPALMKAGTV